MNRRRFAGSLLTITTAVATVGPAALGALGRSFAAGIGARASKEKPEWTIGCYTRAFDQFDYTTGLDAMAEAGFKQIGLMTTNKKDWVLVKSTTPAEEVEGLRREAQKRGLAIASVYGDFAAGESVEAGVDGLKKLIDHTARCGSPNLLLGGVGEAKLVRPYYQAIKECCAYATGKGVVMTIKPHGGQNATGPQCRKLIEQVNEPGFRLWYDPGNIFYYSDGKLDPREDAATVDGLVVGMSAKDFKPPKEVLVTPGNGKVDFPAVLKRLYAGGFTKGPLLIECLERGPLDKVKADARKTRLFLEQLIDEL